MYIYNALGTKLKKQVYQNNILISEKTYAGSFIYNDEGLEYVLFDEGRLTPSAGGNFYYEYFLKDLPINIGMGNKRVVFKEQTGGVAILQVGAKRRSRSRSEIGKTHYYPFGMEFMGTPSVTMDVENFYKYNGKELQPDGFDLNSDNVLESRLMWYDYGARFYDAQLGRWHTVDPKSEIARRWTPYQYTYNNPIRYIDPDGMVVDGYITGPDADKAVEDMNKSTSLTITRDSKTGKLSATGTAKTDADKTLNDAINDPNVDVNLETTKDNYYTAKDDGKEHPMIVGAYEGSEITKKADGTVDKVETKQLINIDQAEKIETGGGSPVGESVIHEFIESYIGGVDDPGGNYNTGYNNAHNKTVKLTPHFNNTGSMAILKNKSGKTTGYGWNTGKKLIELFKAK